MDWIPEAHRIMTTVIRPLLAAARHAGLRVIHLAKNYGKAMALRAGVLASRAEFLVCLDADTLLDDQAIPWMIAHFLNASRDNH